MAQTAASLALAETDAHLMTINDHQGVTVTRTDLDDPSEPVRQSQGVPHTCHDTRRSTVIGSHSKALETTPYLRISRSSPSVK
jgi:hypothetical protein